MLNEGSCLKEDVLYKKRSTSFIKDNSIFLLFCFDRATLNKALDIMKLGSNLFFFFLIKEFMVQILEELITALSEKLTISTDTARESFKKICKLV